MKMKSLLYLLLLLSSSSLSVQDPGPRVITRLGPVVGTSKETETGKAINSFTGIPYIKPPVGELRFKPPQPIEAWQEDLMATNNDIMCTQAMLGPVMGSEDCVILSVHTPREPSTPGPLSVMVFVHGGGFVGGSSGGIFTGQPDYLLEHDVVLVALNYRVGVLGFLSTEDSEAPGNYGLLDQVEGLKWVRDNIAAFGGNPDDVTIFGESAGSASVHLLMLSPLAKGLFNKAIGQSGSSLCSWAMTQRSKEMAQKLAKKVGCPESPSGDLLGCLRKVDAEKLTEIDVLDGEKYCMMPFVWSPRVDSESSSPFLPRHPFEILKEGDYNKVPTLFGHTRSEGAMFLSYPKPLYDLQKDNLESHWDDSCKAIMSFREFFVPEDEGSAYCTEIKQRYINEHKSFEENKMAYADAIGDLWMLAGILKADELMTKHHPVYSYLFNYESDTTSITSVFFGGNKQKGVVPHGEELLYIFKYDNTGWTTESPEYKIVSMTTKIWTDFAKNGKPSIPNSEEPWPQSEWPNHKYVVIDTKPSIQENYREEHVKFANEIYEQTLYKTESNNRDEL